jgi:hypothetical protein
VAPGLIWRPGTCHDRRECWSVGRLLVECWSPTNTQKRSPYKGYRYICMCFVGLLVFFLFPFFWPLFFFKTDPATDQQTNKPTLGPNSLRSIAGHGVSVLVANANKPPCDQHSAATTLLHPPPEPHPLPSPSARVYGCVAGVPAPLTPSGLTHGP